MAIDPSIALQTQPFRNQFNPLANLQQAQQLQSNALAIQQQQKSQAAQQAIGQAVQQATDPDGSVDQGKARALMAQNPDAAYGMQEAVTAANAQQGQQISNSDHQLAYQQHAQTAIGSVLSSVANDPTPTNLQAAGTLAKNLFPQAADKVDTILTGIQQHPEGARAGVLQLINQMQAPATQQDNAVGTNQDIGNGAGTISGVRASPMAGGGFAAQNYTANALGPETLASQVDVTGSDGVVRKVPLSQVLAAQGQQTAPTGVQSTNAQGKPTMPAAWASGGRYGAPPSVSASSGAPPAAGSGGQTPPAAQGFAVTPAPGTVAALAAPQVAGADAANGLMTAASGSPERKAILGNMTSDLDSFTSGPGKDALRHFQSVFNNWTGANWNAQGIDAAQSFNKFGQQIAQQQATALGVGSDAKLASSVAANPNSHLQTNTNQQILHVLQGNEDAINAKANAWQSHLQSGGQPGDYQSWNQNFNQKFDPRAFQMLRMSPEERANLQQQMAKTGQLDAFKQSVNAMGDAGLLPLPGQGVASTGASGGN
jgi:hypothetical protein